MGTSTKCRIFQELKTYLTKTKHGSFSFSILINLIVAKWNKLKHKLLPFFILSFVAVTSHVTTFAYVIHINIQTFVTLFVCESLRLLLLNIQKLDHPLTFLCNNLGAMPYFTWVFRQCHKFWHSFFLCIVPSHQLVEKVRHYLLRDQLSFSRVQIAIDSEW